MRDTTERPEGINAGTLKLAGTDEETIYQLATELLVNRSKYEEMAKAAIRMVMAMPHQELPMRSCIILDNLKIGRCRLELKAIQHDVMRKKLYSAFLSCTLELESS